MAENEKIIYILTHGVDDPERATYPLTLAVAAQVMEVEAVVVLQGAAVYLAKKGIIEHVHAAGLMPLKELVDNFVSEGGRILVCVPCIKERKIEESDLIEGAVPAAGGTVTEEILSARATLVY
ncbi:MAG: DsrE family protein [Desulfobulbaceae bacterium]|nr:DsrE family protein [Desulfobulbaceae bacterium]